MEIQHWDEGDLYTYTDDADPQYHTLHTLIDTHSNTNRLSHELEQIRDDIIGAYKHRDWAGLHQLKIEYTEFADQIDKENETFNKVLLNLDEPQTETDFIGDNIGYNQYNDFEIIENLSHKSDIPKLNTLDWQLSLESNEETPNTQQTQTENIITPNKTSNARKRRLRRKKVSVRPRPTVANKAKQKRTKAQKMSKKQNSNAIYSSVTLFCKETCNENATDLRNLLSECGGFRNVNIEEILFKSGNYNLYAIVKVRGDIQSIRESIASVNGCNYGDILSLFERRNNRNDLLLKPSPTLFVNNFDILGKNTMKKVSNFFSKYGALDRDIKIGIDRNNEPYAIVRFKDVKSAKKCVKSEMKLNGKVLNVRFSKF